MHMNLLMGFDKVTFRSYNRACWYSHCKLYLGMREKYLRASFASAPSLCFKSLLACLSIRSEMRPFGNFLFCILNG